MRKIQPLFLFTVNCYGRSAQPTFVPDYHYHIKNAIPPYLGTQNFRYPLPRAPRKPAIFPLLYKTSRYPHPPHIQTLVQLGRPKKIGFFFYFCTIYVLNQSHDRVCREL